ncbi:T9SS type A sorting domain-containing protein [Niastella populi]|uniref:PA14 domain-containing protein n=1 Tax=Niastella populi TaxID=550983 RepID=A0A1V9FX95_9BACT|nr:T9SS type A sorting domain-containing protein [Niastella populi]OQP62944.1 hypothetical protein A4R26_17340 [Niastella populi]
MKTGKLLVISLLLFGRLNAQTCASPQGDQNTYGTNDTWIGYVYNNNNFTNYYGYVTEGSGGNMNFDQSFGGDNVTYAVNGCNIQTEDFSIRYKLNKNFTDNDYTIIVGGDDGYRFSIDGGVTWVLQDWGGHGYTTRQGTFRLNGSTNLVIEYFDNGGGNRISFSICSLADDPGVYGTNNVWRGYVYDNPDFTAFKGTVFEGSAMNPFFDQNFGGDDVTYYTNTCSINTQTFSVRYRLRKTFNNENVVFLVGGDDGYRFSLDGGANWVIQNWNDHVYMTDNYTATLTGTYDMVLEYYENGGSNRISFDMNSTVLPIELLRFTGNRQNGRTHLYWSTTLNSNTEQFIIERSADGRVYDVAGEVEAASGINIATGTQYAFTDKVSFSGSRFYRLKMIDLNGIVTYSEVITIKNNTSESIRIYPTVLHAGNQLILESNKRVEDLTITLTDMMGRPAMQKQLPALESNQTTAIVLKRNLVTGVYMVQVKTITGILLNQKIVVQ